MSVDWGNINEYVLLSVLSFLPCRDILQCSLVSRQVSSLGHHLIIPWILNLHVLDWMPHGRCQEVAVGVPQ